MHPQTYSAKAAMLIRRPVAEVFEAFVNPDITTKFWFTKSSGPLEVGKSVQWDWEMYKHSVTIAVKTIEPNKRIVIEWPTTVEFTFTAREDNTTFVSITDSGYDGTVDEIIADVRNSTEGFTLVLASLKALLEHHINLALVADRFPDFE
ncbi:polyketide cyclase [Flavobacterium supellecticarium]|uniref:Polyketide cyclase n=1 Tax=Flavobacterium supellecticarium TaxID=2565924 RepID=A0A4S4A1N2_9FLAO|nr:SRPBCC family protein [Flavobacterium supellecticarium]THF51839.1 polyketide cyclase [Flavobacterium supellecticarium]